MNIELRHTDSIHPEVQAANLQAVFDELEDRRKYGMRWCDRCALYYHQIECPECRCEHLLRILNKIERLTKEK